MRRLFYIIFLLFILCAAVGCQLEVDMGTEMQGDIHTEEKADVFFYDDTTGNVLTDLSDKFDFKIEEWKYYYDEEADQDRILLTIGIKNKTKTRLDRFEGNICIDEGAADLIASGMTNYDVFESVNLIPKTTANGVSYSVDMLVEKDEWLSEIDADKDELLEKVRNITLKMSWNGGEETVLIVCDKLEKQDA